MNLNGNVPTVFAQAIAKASGILGELEIGSNHPKYRIENDRLKAFQQMSITSSFEDSLIAYHGVDLNEDQKEALAVIYKSTKPWMLGHVVGVLLDKLDTRMANKDFAESVKTIVEQLTKTEDGETGTKLKGMLVQFTEAS